MSAEDWNKVKVNGKKDEPYRVTVLNGEKKDKVAKIAMYQDGVAIIEKIEL